MVGQRLSPPDERAVEDRILVLAPVGRDAELTREFLSLRGIAGEVCHSLEELACQIHEGCAAVVMAEEALGLWSAEPVVRALERQPSWSELPVVLITSSGATSTTSVNVISMLGENTNITLLERPFRPITLVNLLQASLRSRRRQYQVRDLLNERETVLRSINDAFVTVDRGWRFTYVNARAAQQFGLEMEEMLGRRLWDVFPRELDAQYHEQLHLALHSQQQLRFEQFVPAEQRWFDVRVYPSPDGLSLLSSDITARKRAEADRSALLAAEQDARREAEVANEKLLKSAQRLKFMAESMPQKIFTAARGGSVDYVNEQWCEFTGLPASALLGRGWFETLHPDDRAKTEQGWATALSRAEAMECEHRVRDAAGTYRWHLTRVRPMRDENGVIGMWIGSNTDIEDQKKAEERLELIVSERTQKLRETIGELEAFSYSISHDLRSPLRAMQAFSQALNEDFGPGLNSEGRWYLDRISSAATRLDKLITDVLTYSRVMRAPLTLQPVNLEHLLTAIVEQYPTFQPFRENISLERPLLSVMGHEGSLTQCVTNLLSNALKFIAPGRTPEIRVWTEDLGTEVLLSISDNGIGIARKDQARVFGMFQRVHPENVYEGSGIGLAIVRKAVERMGGTLELESNEGAGSKFSIRLTKA